MLGTKTRRTLGNLFDWVSRKAFPKWYNIRVCSTEGLWDPYFTEAEQWMQESWERYIWPVIKGYRFDTVLELAPGAGRNTEKLAQLAKVLHAVDLNDYALNRLRERFRSYTGTCKLHFHRNGGADLAMIDDGTITFIYCWDSAVHFDRTVIRSYVKEFARVLAGGGVGFVHHSNLGDSADVDIRKNPHGRSNMSKELFAGYCKLNGLEVLRQIDRPWHPPINGVLISDCLSVFRRSAD